MKRIALTVLFAALASSSYAQQSSVRACPPEEIPEAYKSYPIWGPDGAGIAPVSPYVLEEVRKGRAPREVVAEAIRGPALGNSVEKNTELRRSSSRLERFHQIYAFTPPGTDINDLQPLPAEFKEVLKKATTADQLEEAVLPCWSVIQKVTYALPDRMIDGFSVPDIGLKPSPYLLGWCDTIKDGKCGVRIVQTKELIPITSGPNKGAFYRSQMILNCGNPNAQIELPNVALEVLDGFLPVPKSEPVLGTLQFSKVCQTGDGAIKGCPDDMKPVFVVKFSDENQTTLKLADAHREADGALTTATLLLPGKYSFSEEPIRDWVARYVDDNTDFSITEGTTTIRRVVNHQEEPAPAVVVAPPVRTTSNGIPCINRFRWYCLAPIALGAFAIPRGSPGSPPAVISTPGGGKTGGPGGSP